MSGQRARPPIPADHRSAHPDIPGVPWWGAVLIAVVASTLGFAFNVGSNGRELTGVFSALYVVGCLAAVLAVRQAGVFTAVIQPPLILFVMVPGAYYLMHSSDIHGIKDVLINCGYPLIERFPLMFFTAATVLLIGLARWYLIPSSRAAAPAPDQPRTSGVVRLSAKLASLLGSPSASDPAPERRRRRHSVDRRASDAPRPPADPTARGQRPVKRTGAPSRSRHARPPRTDPVMDADRPRPRRRRPDEPPPAAEPRRRGRGSSKKDARRAVPPGEHRPGYDEAERRARPQPGRRYDDYERWEPHPRMANGSHHPVSRVRYRAADQGDQPEYRPRRGPRDAGADRWEYDI
ncbi:MAG: hypothetical protein K0U80_15740 [Actinomycetia bacterium]|nr:hypothetical protein [Actinomycetes bacterium]